MRIPIIKGLALCSLLLWPGNDLAEVHHRTELQEQDQRKPYRSPFRYVVLGNEISGASKTERHVGILLDNKVFSVETCKELFRLVSKRFPEPDQLRITVFSSLEQLPTPEEDDTVNPSISGGPDIPEREKYPLAFMIREDGNELIRYYPNAPNTKMKTIILKGRDPYSSQK